MTPRIPNLTKPMTDGTCDGDAILRGVQVCASAGVKFADGPNQTARHKPVQFRGGTREEDLTLQWASVT